MEARELREVGLGSRRTAFAHPGADAESVHTNAEDVRGDEADLVSLETDEADEQAVDAGDDETGPEFSPNQDG